MDAERWQRIEALFHRVVELDAQQRAALLESECGGDEELRATLLRMLADDDARHPLLDAPERAVKTPTSGDPHLGRRIGPFELTERVGAGGMGVVYSAERRDGRFEQRVAVKLVRAAIVSDEARRRFERERRALAGLAHPHIARLYDGGETEEGIPYLVMEFVEGLPIDRHCDERRLSIEARLRLFAKVCRAAHHAHVNLVVHSDLKPANILVDAAGDPKLLDFGIARLLEPGEGAASEGTLTIARVMTPEYASPEQLAGASLSTATDVYSLGVVLYALLTGRKPFSVESSAPSAWERAIADREPTRPSSALAPSAAPARAGEVAQADAYDFAALCGTTPARLRRRLAGDLDRIVLMALRREPERRYSSAQEFAADIERHLEGRTVLARDDSWSYRAARFIARNRIAVGASAVVALALVAGAAAALRGERRARLEAQHAQIESDTSRDIADFLIHDLSSSVRRDTPEELARALASIEGEAASVRLRYATDRHRQANLLDGLGRVCMQLSEPQEARELFEEALALRTAEFGENSLEVALSLASLGELAYRRGDAQSAVEHFERALRLQRARPGEAHSNVDRTLNDLAVSLRVLGQSQRAEELHREALELRRARAPRSVLVAESLNNLAGVHLGRGELERAFELLSEALELRRELLGETHPLTLQSTMNLANPLAQRGELERARELFERAERGYRSLESAGLEGLALAQSALASLDMAGGDLVAARTRWTEALELRTRAFGPDHASVATLWMRLAELARREAGPEVEPQALQRARDCWDHALRIQRAQTGAGGAALGRVLRSHAVFLMDTGDSTSAESELREALELLRADPAGDRAEVARAELCLGMCLRDSGSLEEGRRRLSTALELFEQAPGASPREIEYARQQLAATP